MKSVRNSSAGFSLVELMVVVAIIGILATIAVPQVNKFMAKARQSESKGNLSTLYTAEKAFFAEYNTYFAQFQTIGFSPEGELKYRVGFAAAGVTQGALDGKGYRGVASTAGINSQVYCSTPAAGCTELTDATTGVLTPTSTTSQTTFLGSASSGNIGYNLPDTWTIDHLKVIRQTQSGIN